MFSSLASLLPVLGVAFLGWLVIRLAGFLWRLNKRMSQRGF